MQPDITRVAAPGADLSQQRQDDAPACPDITDPDTTDPDTTDPGDTDGSEAKKAKIKKVKVKGPRKTQKGKKATYKIKISNSGNAQATGVKLGKVKVSFR